ncbi:MAG: LptF/LptG family permease [Cytophagaceae bacterium]|nr:LptF/LptG family permease [Cytophagaceae bacterium]
MKKLDKLVLRAFFGPFLVTFCVVEFIFIMRFIMLYLDEIAGKDIGLQTYGELLFYCSVVTVPISMPLAVLLSSLMCFGNLGEFFELTAIKSAGISMIRAFRPVGIFVVLTTIYVFWFNNNTLPWANLKFYSLLYDIKTKKAALNIKQGIFYTDLPGRRIKVDKKYPDGRSLKGLIIYDHTDVNSGNRHVILADSGQMYTILDDKYLVFELFNGNDYLEDPDRSSPNVDQSDFTRNQFKHTKLVMSLKAFDLKKTDEDQFKYSPVMKNLGELEADSDSLRKDLRATMQGIVFSSPRYYLYHLSNQPVNFKQLHRDGKWIDSVLKKTPPIYQRAQTVSAALSQAKNNLSWAETNESLIVDKEARMHRSELEWHHKFTSAIACLVMFLIGAPLGSIIKKGGFGLPVLVAIIFFILMYVMTVQGDKLGREGRATVPVAAWLSNAVLFGFGVFFLKRAVADSRLFEADVYRVYFVRLRERWESWLEANRLLKKSGKGLA